MLILRLAAGVAATMLVGVAPALADKTYDCKEDRSCMAVCVAGGGTLQGSVCHYFIAQPVDSSAGAPRAARPSETTGVPAQSADQAGRSVDSVQQLTITPWLNRDTQSGSGDYELLSDFLKSGQACDSPADIECRRRSDQADWRETGEIVHCEASKGLACVNAEQPKGKTCSDYEVRFICPVGMK